MMKGAFISFEGTEGSGKSTHVEMLAKHLESEGYECLLTVEPGGTAIGFKIRELLLSLEHEAMDPVTELLLYSAARKQHLEEVILNALDEGKVVITDRFSDSTQAYQGTARGLDQELIVELDRITTGGIKPDLTILLDINPETGLYRNRRSGKEDRLELEDIDFHKRVREGFLAIQQAEPERVKIVDAGRSIHEAHGEIVRLVEEYLHHR
jgi:dTMP kinase